MWVIENDGHVLHGKTIWLRPGKKFLFGRTGVEAGGFTISNKTISRKHLTLEISQASTGDAANPGKRSQVSLTDLNTKIGTTVDGEQIRGETRVLGSGNVFEVRLGHFEHAFRISWRPCVLTFSFTTKELRSNPLVALHESLGPLDIKVDLDYRPETTHVVVAKRNTPKGLQALIYGKYIVHRSFVQAILSATASDANSPAPLESDFIANWPKETSHLPPKGAEKTDQPDSAYAPDEARKEMFEGYTFVFYSRIQFDILLAPITAGKGKALFREVDPDTTKVNQFVEYVKNVAGEKGLGPFDDGSEGQGVVVVRFIPKDEAVDWYENFVREASLQLDHRMIDQSEFLDAILNNNASVLRKPLEDEHDTAPEPTTASVVMAPPSTAVSYAPVSSIATSQTLQDDTAHEAAASCPPESSAEKSITSAPPVRSGRSRRAITKRFKGFDDFDIPEVIAEESQSTSLMSGPQEYQGNDANSMFVSQNSNMEFDASTTQQSRKRQLTPTIEEVDMMESLAPAAAQLKRRKLEESAARKQRGEKTPPPKIGLQIKNEPASTKPKKKKDDIDVLEFGRRQREKAEELARQERESLQEAMDGMDIESIRHLAIVEDMPVLRSVPRPDENARWDDRWNGRKNFKKFRRRGEDGDGPRRGGRVIVPLEEVKKRDFGIGDEYWLENATASRSEVTSQVRSQTTSQSQGVRGKSKGNTQGTASRTRGTVAGATSHRDDDIQVIASDNEDIRKAIKDSEPEATPFTTARSQRSSARASQATTSESQSGSKRAATETLQKEGRAKKARATPATAATLTRSTVGTRTTGVASGEEDSDDGLGFRFGRRRK